MFAEKKDYVDVIKHSYSVHTRLGWNIEEKRKMKICRIERIRERYDDFSWNLKQRIVVEELEAVAHKKKST